MWLIAGVLLAFCCTSCGNRSTWAPPPQVVLPSGPEPDSTASSGERLLVAMSDPDANAHILGDVFSGLDRSEFRFTGLDPQFVVNVDDVTGLAFYVRFFNHDDALRARGPVSFTVGINGKSFRTSRFDAPGDQVYRWPLPDGWLEKPGPVEISLKIGPAWRRPDGKDYGVLLHSIGFERRPPAPAGASRPPDWWHAILQVAAILFAAGFTFFVSLCLGKSLLKLIPARLYRSEELFVGFVLGAAALSTIVFFLSVLWLAYTWVFFITGCGIIAIAWKRGAIRLARDKLPGLPRGWSLAFAAVYGLFAALYFVAALCPESSVDGTVYHVALPARYLREHHISAITTNLFSTLSEGAEMLYLFAFGFGKHSAAAMVHLLFTLAAPLGILSFAKRIGSPVAGAAAALLFFLSPATGFVGTVGYVDVAAACVVFAVFYLIQIWREREHNGVLVAAGILAGFAYAIKYTAGFAIVYAAGAVIWHCWRTRKPVFRPCAIVTLCAFAMAMPWLIKNTVAVGNPVAPFANRIFTNPYISGATEHAVVVGTGSLGGLRFWEWPYDIAARGSHTQGFIGPIFLLTPLALAALASPVGRQLLSAAAVLFVPCVVGVPVRYLLPALTFLCVALGLVLSRWKYVAASVIVLHAILSWPQVTDRYAGLFGPPGPRLEMPDWRAALRLRSESDYLQEHVYGEERVDGYGIGGVLDRSVGPRDRILAFRSFQQAYHSRDVLVEWESETGVRLGESVRAAIDPLYQPTEQHRFSFPPHAVRRIRLLQTGRATTIDQWSVSELRVFKDGRELVRAPQWRLRASPNPWNVQMAFDGSPLTRWASRAPASPGMFIEVDFGRPQTIDLVAADCTPRQSGIEMDLEADGVRGAKREIVQAALSPRLRRAAVENLMRQNVQWLVVHETDPGARDFEINHSQWGIRPAGASERYRLYHLEPEVSRASGARQVSAMEPLRLDGFYQLEDGRFRWTKREFAVTFGKAGQPGEGTARLTLSIYIPESTIRKLGSLKLTARLGDHVLAPATYRQSGSYTFEREVETRWLVGGPNRFDFALDKSLPPTPADPRELGIIVTSAMLHN